MTLKGLTSMEGPNSGLSVLLEIWTCFVTRTLSRRFKAAASIREQSFHPIYRLLDTPDVCWFCRITCLVFSTACFISPTRDWENEHAARSFCALQSEMYRCFIQRDVCWFSESVVSFRQHVIGIGLRLLQNFCSLPAKSIGCR